eukprot:m.8904 g.8904  ORF g.8904 m.8904 type:complete len:834 (+) comp20963_c0_seq2:88-2589(+)
MTSRTTLPDDFRKEFDTMKASLTAKLKVATRQRDEARTQVADRQKRVETMAEEIAEVERRNAECQRIILGYEKEVHRLKASHVETHVDADVRSARDDLRQLARANALEAERMRATIVELEQEREELHRHVQSREDILADLGMKLDAEMKSKEAIAARNRALVRQIAELHERFEKLSHDRVSSGGEEVEALQRECSELKEKKEMTWQRYLGAVMEKERSSQQLDHVLERLDEVGGEMEAASMLLKEEQAARMAAEEQLMKLRRLALDSGVKGEGDKEKELKATVQNYKAALKERDAVLNEFSQLKMENELFTNQAKIKSQEFDELKQKYTTLKSKAVQLKSLVYQLREAHVAEYVTVDLVTNADIGFFLETQIRVREVLPSSLAHQKGILPEDTILRINDQPLGGLSVFEVQRLVVTAKDGLSLLLERRPTARIDEVIMTAGDALSLHTQAEGRSLVNESRRKDGHALSASTECLDGSTIASFIPNRKFSDGPSLTARRREREITIKFPGPEASPPQRYLGLHLKGGNMVGIFVSRVNKHGPANGVQKGDQILTINNHDVTSVTLEEAGVVFMQAMRKDTVTLTVCKNSKKYSSLTVPYDSFFIRSNFSYDGSAINEMNFSIGDILHVTESAPIHHRDSWMARKLGVAQGNPTVGAVPNETRAWEYLKTSGRPENAVSAAYECLDPARISTLIESAQERAVASRGKRDMSLGDQLSLQDRASVHDRYSSHEPGKRALPVHISDELCQLLDRDNPTERDWRDLANMMGLTDSIAKFAQHLKPTSRVLESWQTLGGDIGSLEWLVKALYRMGRIDAAMLLAPYADDLDLTTTAVNL